MAKMSKEFFQRGKHIAKWADKNMTKQHKWHKEIKAWADGAEIEMYIDEKWIDILFPLWHQDNHYRIKPQPKEPQYINVYGWLENGNITFKQYGPYLGKIKLEANDQDE
jgi:hypothetical protein